MDILLFIVAIQLWLLHLAQLLARDGKHRVIFNKQKTLIGIHFKTFK